SLDEELRLLPAGIRIRLFIVMAKVVAPRAQNGAGKQRGGNLGPRQWMPAQLLLAADRQASVDRLFQGFPGGNGGDRISQGSDLALVEASDLTMNLQQIDNLVPLLDANTGIAIHMKINEFHIGFNQKMPSSSIEEE